MGIPSPKGWDILSCEEPRRALTRSSGVRGWNPLQAVSVYTLALLVMPQILHYLPYAKLIIYQHWHIFHRHVLNIFSPFQIRILLGIYSRKHFGSPPFFLFSDLFQEDSGISQTVASSSLHPVIVVVKAICTHYPRRYTHLKLLLYTKCRLVTLSLEIVTLKPVFVTLDAVIVRL